MQSCETFYLSSSLRARPVEESIKIASSIAMSRGVSRVVDVTWLDRIGIPVYSSIRPDGMKGSVCVHAGKGFTHAEAKIGAYMEGIEFSFAQPGKNAVDWLASTPREISSSFKDTIRFTEFCPVLGSRISADDSIAAVRAEEIYSGFGEVLVPAERVYHPYSNTPGVRLYGTGTNGLASGNTLLEATVHGLAEVMERHVRSFEVFDDKSLLVALEKAPPKVLELSEKIRSAGLTCYLRYSKNAFGLAYFTSYVLEPDEEYPISVAAGFGFHPNAEIAAVRAIAEAVQGRLSHIHGGRDDIIKRVQVGEQMGRSQELVMIRKLRAMASDMTRNVPFEEIPSASPPNIESALNLLYAGLAKADISHVARVVLTTPDYPFQVVKIIVPGAEMYNHEIPRVGPRLLSYVRGMRSHHE